MSATNMLSTLRRILHINVDVCDRLRIKAAMKQIRELMWQNDSDIEIPIGIIISELWLFGIITEWN